MQFMMFDSLKRIWHRNIKTYPNPQNFQWTRWLLLRGLGGIALIAFVSFWVQLEGLVGPQGILPADSFLQRVSEQLGAERYFRFPTLAWLDASGFTLHLMAGLGVIASLMLLFNIAPALSVFLVWLLYLSLCVVGQVFMQYQWDNLLIETSFLAIFIAPWQWWPRRAQTTKVNPVSVWLFRLLLFKLIFASGLVKLASGDPTWSGFTALTYHFFTQPLPTVFGWLAHQLPDWILKGMTFLSLAIEIAVPFLIVTTRRLRQVAGYVIGALMVLIGLTGNYGFFNLLGLLLCISLFDDRAFRNMVDFIKGKIGMGGMSIAFASPSQSEFSIKRYAMYLYLALYLVVSLIQLTNITGKRGWIPEWGKKVNETVRATRTINSYGLFANMTTERPEIVVQGSRDGRTWKTYRFKYKAGALDEAPTWAQPHMPRLDWQMWFAALGNYRQNPWFMQFLVKLLQDRDPVLDLIEKNPFPDRPPQYIRAIEYNYKFTTLTQWWQYGRWWEREQQQMYVPAFSLQQLRRNR